MPKIGQMMESKYLKQSDVDGDVTVTVQKVGQKNVARDGDEPEMKWMVKFEEFTKPMVLNSTNIKRLAKSCESEDTDDWTGKKAILYVDPDIEFGGNVVGGLRIKPMPKQTTVRQVMPKQNGGKFDDMPDDVPF
jgi:hypothetical protein